MNNLLTEKMPIKEPAIARLLKKHSVSAYRLAKIVDCSHTCAKQWVLRDDCPQGIWLYLLLYFNEYKMPQIRRAYTPKVTEKTKRVVTQKTNNLLTEKVNILVTEKKAYV